MQIDLFPKNSLNKPMGGKFLSELERLGVGFVCFTRLLVDMDWKSSRCQLVWKVRGGMYNRYYCQLYPSNKEKILPTPRVKGQGNSHQRIREGKIDDLTTMARFNMLPTPMVQYGQPAKKEEIFGMNKMKNGKRVQGLQLHDLATHNMLPTPTCQDAGKATKKMREGHQNNLTAIVFNQVPSEVVIERTTSHLSPQFVMEMMGFPIDWTLLPFIKENL